MLKSDHKNIFVSGWNTLIIATSIANRCDFPQNTVGQASNYLANRQDDEW